MKCILCGLENKELVHKGTRDNPDIDVYRCNNCGMVFLSEFPTNVEEIYEQGDMHINGYDESKDQFSDIDFEKWVELTKRDDDRRFNQLKDLCNEKTVLEFGCGNGGFLNRISAVAKDVVGVELDKQSLDRINSSGIKCVSDIEVLDKKYDVIVCFHVIEHLIEPQKYLKQIFNHLEDGGIFICETCNVEDALISYYNCEAYKDFTFWSEHVYLYNSDTLEKMINSCGFKTVNNTQIQRYPLSNHMYWLKEGRPGGHTKLLELNDVELNMKYEEILKKMGKCDTLFGYFKK